MVLTLYASPRPSLLPEGWCDRGAEAIVIEGAEAGGHIGSVSTSVLAQEILPHLADVPVFIAGGIGRGDLIAAYLEMGASGCQLGTRFVCAEESVAHDAFKQAFIRASARDAVPSVQLDPQFPVIPVRALRNGATRAFLDMQRDVIAACHRGELGREAAQLRIEHFWAGALRRAVVDGDVETGSMMAGQSVGMVRTVQPAADIMRELVQQACDALASRYPGSAGQDGHASAELSRETATGSVTQTSNDGSHLTLSGTQ